MTWPTSEVHISQIRPGDTVIHNGKEMTVSHNNITHCSFMGKALFGDTYKSGTKPVVRVEIQRALPQK